MFLKIIGLSALLATLPAAADAAVITVNFAGKYNDYSQLSNQNFTGSFAYDDTKLPSENRDYDGDGNIDQRVYDNFLTSALKITDSSGTKTLSSADAFIVSTYSPSSTNFYLGGMLDAMNLVSFQINTDDTSFAKTAHLPSSFPALKDGSTSGSIELSGSGVGDLTSLSAGAPIVAAVPEMSTWAMMLGGIGVAGSAIRRRRVPARVAFA